MLFLTHFDDFSNDFNMVMMIYSFLTLNLVSSRIRDIVLKTKSY